VLAQNGFNVVLHGRSRDRLESLAAEFRARYGISTRIMEKDLHDPRAPEEMFQELQDAGIDVDVLVNNAGVGTYGRFDQVAMTTTLDLLQLNVVALVHLTRLFLPGMVKRRFGRILNVASTAAFQPGPLMANYYASKAYVFNFTVSLADELRGTGVSVSVLCPGPTLTRFQERAGIRHLELLRMASTSAAEVAKRGYEGLERGKTVIVPGLLNKLGAFSVRFLPYSVSAAVVRLFHRQRGRSGGLQP